MPRTNEAVIVTPRTNETVQDPCYCCIAHVCLALRYRTEIWSDYQRLASLVAMKTISCLIGCYGDQTLPLRLLWRPHIASLVAMEIIPCLSGCHGDHTWPFWLLWRPNFASLVAMETKPGLFGCYGDHTLPLWYLERPRLIFLIHLARIPTPSGSITFLGRSIDGVCHSSDGILSFSRCSGLVSQRRQPSSVLPSIPR